MMAFPAVEILVVSFEETVVNSIGVASRSRVCAEHYAILILQEELAGGVRLPAEFRDSGIDIDIHVRVLVELLRDTRQVLRVVAEVRVDECRFRVLLDQAMKLVEQVMSLWELNHIKVILGLRFYVV